MTGSLLNREYTDVVDEFDLHQPRYLTLFAVLIEGGVLQNPIEAVRIRDTVRQRDEGTTFDITAELDKLADGGYVAREEPGKYFLTKKGLQLCFGRESASSSQQLEELPLIDIEIDKKLYSDNIENHKETARLIEQINRSYRSGIYAGTAILARRMFEQLTWNLSRAAYSPEVFLTDDGNPEKFGNLISNMKSNPDGLRGQIKPLQNTDEIQSFLQGIDRIRKLGNDGAHGIDTSVSREDIQEHAEDYNQCLDHIYSLLVSL